VIKPFVGTGSWSVALSHFAGITPVIPPPGQWKRHTRTLIQKLPDPQAFLPMPQERGKKISEEHRARPHMCWPVALRAVRGWLEPWIMLRRYWRAWSEQPLPPLLQRLLDQLGQGQGLFLYGTF
jgi:hypothetical protein